MTKFVKKKPHKTRKLIAKTVNVDIGIVEVVRWLNRFKDIFTYWSCQGDKDDPFRKPYVVFVCSDSLILSQVLATSHAYAKTEVEFYRPSGSLRYIMEFASIDSLATFTSSIPKEHS